MSTTQTHGPRSWTSDVSVGSVSLLTCWNAGWCSLRNICGTLSLSIADVHTKTDLDLLRPFGEYVSLTDNFDFTASSPGDELPDDEVLTDSGMAQHASDSEDVSLQDTAPGDQLELEDLLPEVGEQDLDAV